MRISKVVIIFVSLTFSGAACQASPVLPFGVASAYNLVALGTVNSSSQTLLPGNITDNTDVTGRIAAAGTISGSLTIGSSLNGDPYGSAATYGLVAAGGLGVNTQVNMNGGGNAYAPGSNGSFNFNDSGHRVTSGSSGIDFDALRTQLDALSLQLAGQTANGVNGGLNYPGVNPSFYVLKGTDPNLNVFNISAAVFASSNNPIDIIAPVGSTIIVNVAGTSPTLGTPIYYNGTQHSGNDAADDHILFNFATATTVSLNAGFSGSVLSPFAFLTGTGQIDGNFIAAQIGQTGEVHNVEFAGTLPSDPGKSVVPEPGTIALMGSGMLAMAGLVRRRIKS